MKPYKLTKVKKPAAARQRSPLLQGKEASCCKVKKPAAARLRSPPNRLNARQDYELAKVKKPSAAAACSDSYLEHLCTSYITVYITVLLVNVMSVVCSKCAERRVFLKIK